MSHKVLIVEDEAEIARLITLNLEKEGFDTGQGIAAEDLPHVFERFWRSGMASRRNSRSSGIGLAISRRLVELQGGEIEVESELGKGSTFRFSLTVA